MKGRVLSYSIQENRGVISGDDGARYAFVGSEWNEHEAPQRQERMVLSSCGCAVIVV